MQPLTPQDLSAAGKTLFGVDWKAPMSRALPAPLATLKAWSRNDRTPRPAEIEQYRPRLAELLDERIAALQALRRKLRAR